jgi:ABC-type polysaccharide/polyol phosphate export permease
VFVLNVVITEFINFAFGFLALVVFALISGKVDISWAWLSIPYVILITALFGLGLSALLSVMTVYFRDLFHVVPIFMQIGFFLTPILYNPKNFPEKFQFLLKLNPLGYFVEVLRYPMYQNIWPSMRHLGFVSALAFITATVGLYVLKKFDNKIVFKL